MANYLEYIPPKTDLDLPPAYRTQANLYKSELGKYYKEIRNANKGLQRLSRKLVTVVTERNILKEERDALLDLHNQVVILLIGYESLFTESRSQPVDMHKTMQQVIECVDNVNDILYKKGHL